MKHSVLIRTKYVRLWTARICLWTTRGL